MKISKKVLIPVFATAMGLSVIGGISGAVAWYQYNTKVTASYVGTSVADTGTLQISNNGSDWERDIVQTPSNLYPVTFGELNDVAPATGYMYPEAGAGAGYTVEEGKWAQATANTHYAQFDLYFRALQTDEEATSADLGYKAVERDVYLSRYVLNVLDADDNVISTKNADEALRVQIAVEGGAQTILGKTAGTNNLFGGLDLDGNGDDDTYHKTAFNTLPTGIHDGDPIVYGNDGDTEEVKAFSDMTVTRGSDGKIAEDTEKKLFTTSDDKDDPIKVTVTIWLEGWALLNNGLEDSAIWNPFKTAGCKVQLGMEFDTGIFRGEDLA